MKKLVGSLLFILTLNLLAAHSFSQTIKGTYAIKNVQTGMLLRIKDANKSNGTPLVAYSPVNWKCVTWEFNQIEGQRYQLRNLFTSKTFQSKNPRPTDGVELEQQPVVAQEAIQQYEFISNNKDGYFIKLKGTDLYVTPSDSSGAENSTIILSKKNGSKQQQWTIHEQNPDM